MMEEHIETPKLAGSIFGFLPPRRLHLRSESYHTLVRILSHCSENAELSLPTDIDPQELKAAYRQATEEASCEQVGGDSKITEPGDSAVKEVMSIKDSSGMNRQATKEASCEQVGGDSKITEPGDSAVKEVMSIKDSSGMNSVEDGCFQETEGKMDGVRNANGDAGNDKKTSGVSSPSNHCVHEDNHPNEPQHMMEGNEVPVYDNNYDSMIRLDKENDGNDQILLRKQEETAVSQKVLAEEDGTMVQQLSETISSLEGNTIGEVSKAKEHDPGNLLLVAGRGMHQWPERTPKELESEVIVCEHDAKGSHVHSSEVMEVENGERCGEKVSEAVLSCPDKDMFLEDHKKNKNGEDEATSMVVDVSTENYEMLLKDIEMDKLPLIPETMGFPNCMTENGDMEEGEICSDDVVTNRSACAIVEDPIVLAENLVDIQISEEKLNGSKLPSIQANGKGNKPTSVFSDIAEYGSHESKEEFKKNKSSMEVCKLGIAASRKMTRTKKEDQYDFMSEERGHEVKESENKNNTGSFAASFNNQYVHCQVSNAFSAGCKGIVSTEKETAVCTKKKRGPLSEGRKEKKKLKNRQKRAEMNRKLGVKRLKLHPVTVPKPLVYCRHYLKGRCQEGEKCKFSHDTIPLTKSTPCSHFARHSCMKGDDCPFDHELSKYPCSNFASKGSCSRGDACMFSHKVLGKEESTSSPNLKTKLKPLSIPDNLDSQKKLNSSASDTLKQSLVAVTNYTETYRSNTPQSENTPKKATGTPPAGINFLSFGSSLAYSSKGKPVHSSQEKNDSMDGRNVLNHSGFCLVENSNELSRKILLETAPKGINFLSFGKTSLDDSSNKKLATPSSYEDGMKPMTGQDSNVLLKEVQTSLLKDWKQNGELASLSSNWKVASDLSAQDKKIEHHKRESSSSRLPDTSISCGQSSISLASSIYKGRPNSAQKAVLSTMAFAAKYESLMTKNKSSVSAAPSNEGNNEGGNESIGGSLKDDQAKASKLLNFLLGVGIKSNKRPGSGAGSGLAVNRADG